MNDNDVNKAIARHSAGATVQHRGPFSDLEVPDSDDSENRQSMRDKWVAPFYMNLQIESEEFWQRYWQVQGEVNVSLCVELLSWFDWRPRIVGAFFVAIERFDETADLIGRLLLRSDVCFAGRGYALALARIGTPQATDFLVDYLDYYLTRRDLQFDQLACMGALQSLDIRNGTTLAQPFMKRCEEFYSDNHFINCADSVQGFETRLSALESFVAR